MTKTVTIERQVEVCDWCGTELFYYDDRGRPEIGYGRTHYETEGGELLCVPKCEKLYFEKNR